MIPSIIRKITNSREVKDLSQLVVGFGQVFSHYIYSSNECIVHRKPITKKNLTTQSKIRSEENNPKDIFVELQNLESSPSLKPMDERKVPSSVMNRSMVLGGTFFSIASDYMVGSIKNSFTGGKKTRKEMIMNEKNANKLSETLCRMRGAALKLGQALSIQEDSLIPPVLKQTFEKARSYAYKMPKKQFLSVMSTELGEDWRDKFESIEEEPFAAASIGQVHKAVLKNGMKVAVKVQYPGVS